MYGTMHNALKTDPIDISVVQCGIYFIQHKERSRLVAIIYVCKL